MGHFLNVYVGDERLLFGRIMQAAGEGRNEKRAIIAAGRGGALPRTYKACRRLRWTRRSARSAPTTSTRVTTGLAPCPRSARWGSISRNASITAGCTVIG